MSSVIGLNIKKYRKQKGITQKGLGSLVGVTTQAVSKWERGSSPDAELLPAIADVLEVSVDMLFGRDTLSTDERIINILSQLGYDESFETAFEFCGMAFLGLSHEKNIAESIPDGFPGNLRFINDKRIFSKLLYDSGIVSMRLSHDFRYFFLLPSSEQPLNKKLCDRESLRRVFEVLSHPEVLEIIYFMFTRLNTPVSVSLIAEKTGLSREEADGFMQMLVEINLADRSVIATENGDINSYTYRQENSLIALLCFADEICQRDIIDFFTKFERKTPFFN